MARADAAFGIVLMALSVAVIVGSWRMDRLAARHVDPLSVPGLTPGLLGIALAVASLVLIVRAAGRGGFSATFGRGGERSRSDARPVPLPSQMGEGDHAQHGGGGGLLLRAAGSPPPPPSAVPLPRIAGEEPAARSDARAALQRLFLALALCFAYALGLIGRMPFWLATAMFVAAFVALFEWRAGDPPARRAVRLAWAVGLGLAAGFAVSAVFGDFFLVRLP